MALESLECSQFCFLLLLLLSVEKNWVYWLVSHSPPFFHSLFGFVCYCFATILEFSLASARQMLYEL